MNLFSSIFESADGINWKLYIIIILATLMYMDFNSQCYQSAGLEVKVVPWNSQKAKMV